MRFPRSNDRLHERADADEGFASENLHSSDDYCGGERRGIDLRSAWRWHLGCDVLASGRPAARTRSVGLVEIDTTPTKDTLGGALLDPYSPRDSNGRAELVQEEPLTLRTSRMISTYDL